MADATVVIKALLDLSDVDGNIARLKGILAGLGGEKLSKKLDLFGGGLKETEIQIERIKAQLVTLNQLKAQLAAGTRKTVDVPASLKASVRATQSQAGGAKGGEGLRANQLNLLQTEKELTAELAKQVEAREAAARGIQEEARYAQELLAVTAQVNSQVRQGGANRGLKLGVAGGLDKEIATIQQQISDLNAAGAKQGTAKQQKEYARINILMQKGNQLRKQALAISTQIAELELTMSNLADGPRKDKLGRQVTDLQNRRAELEQQKRDHEEEAAKPLRAQKGRTEGAGTADTVRELERRMQTLQVRRNQLFDDDAVAKQFPDMDRLNKSIAHRQGLIEKVNLGGKEGRDLLKDQNRELAELESTQKRIAQTSGVKKGQGALPQEQFQQMAAKMRPGIDRLFSGIFSDMSRRFVATLQFTISAAIIFGTQRLVKEFIQAAIEVERAFADIKSALAFDLGDLEGVELEREISNIRREVLLIANDFNVLPSVVNEAAYVMVARFNDVGNAMVALRSQILATKVSGIEQGEVLRALTATAESFAGAIWEVNDGLSIQEKLINREAIAANVYAEALDNAVLLQQKFGVEVEDTLEGTARAASVFTQMGFSIEETNAIIASVSRNLGQTGQAASEKLVRSMGQITDPKIRDALLDLAYVNEAFELSIPDFESGAKAWYKILGQINSLQKTDPQVAGTILQTIGQRREVEAVAAALGTGDLQKEMIGALEEGAEGAAEKRFEGLSKTMEEIVASIATSFQSVAQTFQSLGGLNSLKLLLLTLDKVLGLLNRILDMVVWVRDEINSFFGIKIASFVLQLGFGVASVLSLARAVIALKRAYVELAGAQALSGVAGFFGLGARGGVGVAQAASMSVKSIGLGATVGGVGSSITGGIAAALASPAAPFVAAAAAAVVLGLALKSAADRADALSESFEDGVKAGNEAAAAARHASLEAGATWEEAQDAALAARTGAARATFDNAPSGRPGFLDAIAGSARDANPLAHAWDWYKGDYAKALSYSSTAGIADATLNPQDVEGSKEWWEKRLNALDLILLQDHIDAFKESLEKDPLFGGLDVSHLAPEESVNVAREQLLMDADSDRAQQLRTEAFASTDEGERSAKLAQAAAIMEDVRLRQEMLVDKYGNVIDSIEVAVNILNKELAGLGSQVTLGELTNRQAGGRASEIADELLTAANQARAQGNIEDADDYLEDSRQARIAALNFEKTAVTNDIASAQLFTSNRASIQAEIDVLTQALRNMPPLSPNGPIWTRQLIEARLRLADANEQAILDAYEFQVQLARTFESQSGATKSLIAALRRAAAETSDPDDKGALLQRAALMKKQLDQDLYDNTTREAQATLRLAGPVLDPLTAIMADLIGANRKLNSSFSGTADKLDALVAIKELQAKYASAELSRLVALTLANVSVRDSMKSMHVEISGLKRESELAAKQYGADSKAALDAARAVKNAEAKMIDLVLNLESVNRQLAGSFDVTDPLQSAEEDYISIMRQLQIPDLGAVERAALELQAKNAEASLLGAQYDDKLFNLKFQNEQGDLGDKGYVDALKGMLAGVDTSTYAGKQLWIKINGLIEGMTDDLGNMAFNIPGQIRIPTLFEVRRAVQAESMGVNYQDNRQQDINLYVNDEVALDVVLSAIESVFEVEDARHAPGGAGITLGVG